MKSNHLWIAAAVVVAVVLYVRWRRREAFKRALGSTAFRRYVQGRATAKAQVASEQVREDSKEVLANSQESLRNSLNNDLSAYVQG